MENCNDNSLTEAFKIINIGLGKADRTPRTKLEWVSILHALYTHTHTHKLIKKHTVCFRDLAKLNLPMVVRF